MPLTIGEVHTGLLLTSTAVSDDTAAELLAIVPGRSVRTRQRPIRYAWSPEVLTGVDCSAPLAERREVRVVGTPATQVSLTDGRIIQAGTHATFRQDPAGRRRPWAHYLAQPGVLEVLGKASDESLAAGFLRGPATATALDLGAVNVRALADIQRSDLLDRNPPFRSRRTRLRWSAEYFGLPARDSLHARRGRPANRATARRGAESASARRLLRRPRLARLAAVDPA